MSDRRRKPRVLTPAVLDVLLDPERMRATIAEVRAPFAPGVRLPRWR